MLLTGNIILVFLISTVTSRKSIKTRFMFAILICSVWMLVEVLCAMVMTVAGAQNATLSDAGNVISSSACFCFPS